MHACLLVARGFKLAFVVKTSRSTDHERILDGFNCEDTKTKCDLDSNAQSQLQLKQFALTFTSRKKV